MLEIIDCEQNSQIWKEHRCGIVTASAVSKVLAKGEGKTRTDYMNVLIGELWTGEPDQSWAGNEHTERGHEWEPLACDLYEARSGTKLELCGFMRNGRIGYSPDRIIGTNGLAEVKTKLAKLQVAILDKQQVPPENKAQCQTGLLVSEREWLDFISFSKGMPLFVQRVYRDEPYIKTIRDEVERFYDELDKKLERLMSYN